MNKNEFSLRSEATTDKQTDKLSTEFKLIGWRILHQKLETFILLKFTFTQKSSRRTFGIT